MNEARPVALLLERLGCLKICIQPWKMWIELLK